MARGRKKGQRNHNWSVFEEKFLIKNAHLGAPLLAKYLGMSKSAITQKAFKLKISLAFPKSIINLNERPRCKICKERPVASHGINRRNQKVFKSTCNRCRHNTYQKHKKTYCEKCGFVPTVPSQLDVDHIDGNKTNNEITNLQTLCANCHRLKTALNKEWFPKGSVNA